MDQEDSFKEVTGEDIPDYAEKIPALVLRALVNYLYYGDEVGHFLTAVLCNDLTNAVCRADNQSLAAIRELVQLIYNRIPSPAWGSPEKIKAWREQRRKLITSRLPESVLLKA